MFRLYRWQVQLFEESNNIQIVYPSTVPSTGPSATTALLTWSSSFEANAWEVYVTTSSTAPTHTAHCADTACEPDQ